MLPLTLSGYRWLATSPSLLHLRDRPDIALVYLGEGYGWRCAFDGEPTREIFDTREAAARAIADGINKWQMEQYS